VIFLLAGRRQRRARQIKPRALEPLRRVAVLDAGNTRQQHALDGAREIEREAPLAGRVLERAIGGEVRGLGGEALHPHQAAHAMRSGDDAHQHALLRHRSSDLPSSSPLEGEGREGGQRKVTKHDKKLTRRRTLRRPPLRRRRPPPWHAPAPWLWGRISWASRG